MVLDWLRLGLYAYRVIGLATRLLVMLLLVSSTGVLPTAGRLFHGNCEQGAQAGPLHDRGHEGRCADCSPNCAVCICCPLRAAPTMRIIASPPIEAQPQRVALAEPSRVLAGVAAEIFHPPRV